MRYGSVRMMATESPKHPSRPSGNIGDQLREKRLKNGWTLEQLSVRTRIPARHLQTIEEGRGRELPGGFIGKSFVRQYAEAVGLDGEQALQDFVALTGVNLEVAFAARKVSPFTPESLQRFQAKRLKLIALITASVVVIVILIAYLVSRPAMEQGSTESPSAPDTSAPYAPPYATVPPMSPLPDSPVMNSPSSGTASGGASTAMPSGVSGMTPGRPSSPASASGSAGTSVGPTLPARPPRPAPESGTISSGELESTVPPATAPAESNP